MERARSPLPGRSRRSDAVWQPASGAVDLSRPRPSDWTLQAAASPPPARWQVVLPLLAALAVLLAHVHRRVLARAAGEAGEAAAADASAGLETGGGLWPRRRAEDAARAKPRARFLALDVLRGVTVCLMVLVNYGGAGVAALAHSAWDGLTVADVLFPWFAWIMGFSVFLASAARRTGQQTGSQRRAKLRDAAARSLRLFALGLVLNNGPSWRRWRIPGVLQALSVAFLVVAAADLALGAATSSAAARSRPKQPWLHVLLLGVAPLVAVNVAVTFALPVPGCPTGYIGPGGNASTADGGPLANCTGGAHLLVDLAVFGRDHIFQTPTCQQAFSTGPFDPEGLLNWLMVAATALLGYCTGLASIGTGGADASEAFGRRRREAAGAGGALVAAGLVLARWPGIPVNKNLWSLSFVLVSSGLAALALALATLALDKTARFSSASASSVQTWVWAYARFPWTFVGTNAIVVYVLHEVFQGYTPFSPRSMDGGDEPIAWLELALFNLVGVAWWVHVAAWLHQRGVHARI